MARGLKPARGEIWLADLPSPDKRRPVLVMTRSVLLDVLETVTVAAVTSTVRGAQTEVPVGVDEGLKGPSCINLTNIFTVRRAQLARYVGVVPRPKMLASCRALAVAVGCDSLLDDEPRRAVGEST